MSIALPSLALACLAFPLQASTWIVDVNSGPGTNFTQISAAVAAAAPGDTLLVRPGQYANFVLDKPLAIVGQGTAPTNEALCTGATIHDLPPNTTTCIANLYFNGFGFGGLQLASNAGALMLDDVQCVDLVQVTSSSDVRMRRCTASEALHSTHSRLELGDSLVLGRLGWTCTCCYWPQTGGVGGTALTVSGGAVHLARTTLIGGAGGNAICGDIGGCDTDGGNGGAAVALSAGAELLVSGSSDFFLQGGSGGMSNCIGGGTGAAGPALVIGAGCAARISGETISGAILNSGTLVQPSPDDPFLRALGSPTPGTPFTLRLSGPPGATAQVLLGRRPIVVPTPALDEEQLVPIHRVFNMGTIPASGTISLNFPVAPFWPSGFSVVFQGRVTLPDTTQLFTNSLPAIVQ